MPWIIISMDTLADKFLVPLKTWNEQQGVTLQCYMVQTTGGNADIMHSMLWVVAHCRSNNRSKRTE